MTSDDDVPSPIDLRDPETAATWAREADAKRPHRREIRAAFAAQLRELARARVEDAAQLGILDAARLRILELGPGPGFLAEAILAECEVEDYVLLDFSPPFLAMCKERVGHHACVRYVVGDFIQPEWTALVDGPFDAVVSMQAVHELRHKRRAVGLYTQVHPLLRKGGMLLVCDHEPINDKPLAMPLAEQRVAFARAGFVDVQTRAKIGGLYLVSGST
jgi:phospholipid N-methyltransferase